MGYTSTTVPIEVAAALPAYLQAQIPLYDETFQPNLYSAAIISLSFAGLAVGLRFYARRLKRQKLGLDDYTIALSLFFNSAFIALCIFRTVLGLGRHAVVMVLEHPEHAVPFGMALIAAEVLYNPAAACTKYAILILYHRLFEGEGPVVKRACFGIAILVTAYSLTAVFANIFQCMPEGSQWASLTSHCVSVGDEHMLLVLFSSLNAFTDAAILALPMPFIWRLTVDIHRKIQLTVVMLLGSFIVVVSIIRATSMSSNVSPTDVPWANGKNAMWTMVEGGMGVVAACLPLLRPVFNKVVYGDPEGSRPDASPASWNKKIVTFGGGRWNERNAVQQPSMNKNTSGKRRGSFTIFSDEHDVYRYPHER